MPDIPLREYLDKIEDWIRCGDTDQAIAHGRHILALYPECAWTHRVLGEAYLEKGMLSEAQESFERTLAADPENAIAHIGLSLTFDRLGMLPEAIRQMERAFDVAAGNAEVRAELQALYKRRGDSRSSGPALTRGAMARVYANNGLLERAMAEYHEALQQNAELSDARAGLAEAQWRAGRAEEALETCQQLLAKSPGCLKGLLIQGQMLLDKGQQAEGEAALALAQALDPENRLAHAMMGDASPLPLMEVLVPTLAEVGPAEGRVNKEGHVKEEDMGELEASSQAQEAFEGQATPDKAQSPPEEQPEESAAGDVLPEWLEEFTPGETQADTGEGEETVEEPAPAWIEVSDAGQVAEAEEQPEPEEVSDEQPESPAWMETLPEQTTSRMEAVVPEEAADTEDAEEGMAEAAETLEEEETSSATGAAVPDWVRRMEEAVTDERLPAGAEVLGAASGAATPAAAPGNGVSPAERQRIRELTQLLHQEPGKYWARIELARRCCQVGDWDGALLQYEELIAGHKMIHAVILDLQGLLQEETDRVQVYRLLGDAYMESDQIDQALEMYRLARQILRKR